MSLKDLLTTAIRPDPGSRPRDDELDFFGVTHPGKVRSENQDQFLVCTLHQQVVVHGTSLPDADRLPLRGERFASLFAVADGVGSSAGGGEASRLAIETITRFVSSTMRSFQVAGRQAEKEFLEALRAAALEAHDAVRAGQAERNESKPMATTLTLALGVWPQMYVVQVGDSRCYYHHGGTLRQVTRDQTLAQALAEQGVLQQEQVAQSPFSNVLASAIGGAEAAPVVTRFQLARGGVVLLCTDGLTKHVTDAELGERMGAATSAEELCRQLLDLALERGGTDNITVLVARANRRD